MALDSLQSPPVYLGPKADRPEVVVDQQRVLLMDPTDGSVVGVPGGQGAAGRLGRLVYGERSPSNRGF